MEQLSRVLNDANFFAIADGRIWEIDTDYQSILAEAGRMIDASSSHLSSVTAEEMNLILRKHIQDLYAGMFHFIVQNRAACEKLDIKGNFKWAPVKKMLGGNKADLRMLKEYMEIYASRDPNLRFSLGNAITNLSQAIDGITHILVTHTNMTKA